MILYFDSYITDIPLNKNAVSDNDKLRNNFSIYRMPTKIDIAKYTLISYSKYNWSNVLIKYELDDNTKYDDFDSFILEYFPNAIIEHERSDTQFDYQNSLKIIDTFDDDLIFYSANNDHPLICTDLTLIKSVVELAEQYSKSFKFISIVYSHFSEFLNMNNKNTPFNWLFGQDVVLLEENRFAKVLLKKKGENSSILIVNKALMNYWFNSHDLGNSRIIRSENVMEHFITENQILIIPKFEICAHFDGYIHTHNHLYEIRPDQIPPLLIPPGFFEKNININYNNNVYKDNWLNINPKCKNFVFENKEQKTDLKIKIDQLPYFWKDRISQINNDNTYDINETEYYKTLLNPYSIYNKGLNLHTIKYIYRILRYKINILFKS
jgi:hypothetical protein